MAGDSATAKNKNRRIRQEALREQLSAQGHEQHIIDLLTKLMDEATEYDSVMIKRFEVVINTKLKLMNKYIPDLKSTELTGEIQISDMTEMQIEDRIKALQIELGD